MTPIFLSEIIILLIDAAEIGFYWVPAIFILKYQSRMSTTDEGPSHSDGQVSLTTIFTTNSIKLPTFWTDSPKVWFLQAKVSFWDQAHDNLPNQVPSLVSALP